ncbi:hypothetical protein RJ640_005073, partial [Escallonia rubra]
IAAENVVLTTGPSWCLNFDRHPLTERLGDTNFRVQCDMSLSEVHNTGETLQEKLEQLPEIQRAFVHTEFELCMISFAGVLAFDHYLLV